MNLDSFTGSLRRYLGFLLPGERIHPQRDWVLTMALTFILFIGCVSWSYWVFHTVTSKEAAASAVSVPVNTSVVEKVTAIFAARAVERAHYQNDYRFVDPSK